MFDEDVTVLALIALGLCVLVVVGAIVLLVLFFRLRSREQLLLDTEEQLDALAADITALNKQRSLLEQRVASYRKTSDHITFESASGADLAQIVRQNRLLARALTQQGVPLPSGVPEPTARDAAVQARVRRPLAADAAALQAIATQLADTRAAYTDPPPLPRPSKDERRSRSKQRARSSSRSRREVSESRARSAPRGSLSLPPSPALTASQLRSIEDTLLATASRLAAAELDATQLRALSEDTPPVARKSTRAPPTPPAFDDEAAHTLSTFFNPSASAVQPVDIHDSLISSSAADKNITADLRQRTLWHHRAALVSPRAAPSLNKHITAAPHPYAPSQPTQKAAIYDFFAGEESASGTIQSPAAATRLLPSNDAAFSASALENEVDKLAEDVKGELSMTPSIPTKGVNALVGGWLGVSSTAVQAARAAPPVDSGSDTDGDKSPTLFGAGAGASAMISPSNTLESEISPPVSPDAGAVDEARKAALKARKEKRLAEKAAKKAAKARKAAEGGGGGPEPSGEGGGMSVMMTQSEMTIVGSEGDDAP